MEQTTFSLSLLQSINDWQRDGGPKQKEKRAKRLKEEASQLDIKFRTVESVCYRQISLDKRYVWKMADQLMIKETISSWTVDLNTCKEFKGGVAPKGQGFQSMIFRFLPAPESVIINLNNLFKDEAFLDACEQFGSQIGYYSNGIGRYGGSQHEVVLEIDQLSMESIFALGGHSSDKESILREMTRIRFNRVPNEKDRSEFEELLSKSGAALGPNWITGEAKNRVMNQTLKSIEKIKSYHT